MAKLAIGDIQVQRVEEFCGPSIPADFFLTDVPPDALERQAHWLFPEVVQPGTDYLVTSVHSWVVRTRHHNILIDGCYGNHKSRPGLPVGDMMNTDWLDRLAACGLQPRYRLRDVYSSPRRPCRLEYTADRRSLGANLSPCPLSFLTPRI